MLLFQQLTDMKTLLIDDSPEIREILQTAFTSQGCWLKAVETAEEGLCVLKIEQVDIIICDYQLPGINGVEFFKGAAVLQPNAVKVLISGYGDDKMVARALEIGVHTFLKKPFSLVTLLQELMPHLKNRAAGSVRDPAPDSEAADAKIMNKTRSSGIAGFQAVGWPKEAMTLNW